MNTLFIGRWQPLHKGHIALIGTALDKGESVVVAIRDTSRNTDNPYSVRKRKKMLRNAFGSKVKIIVVPDIKKVCIGRDVGYEVIKLPCDIEKISGTKIRKLSQTALTIWLTGLPKAGKTTLAILLKKQLKSRGLKVRVFDGDSVRKSLWGDLKFSKSDRVENMRRVVYLCETYNELNIITIVALVSPYRTARNAARTRLKNFIEVYVKCPLEICESRDKTGMYTAARSGKIRNFTGISDPYEPPGNPDVLCDTETESANECVDKIMKVLNERYSR